MLEAAAAVEDALLASEPLKLCEDEEEVSLAALEVGLAEASVGELELEEKEEVAVVGVEVVWVRLLRIDVT